MDDIERAARVAEALSGFTSCAFCGAEFSRDNDAERIRAHIETCPKHPMGELKDKIVTLQRLVDSYDREMTGIRNALRGIIPEHDPTMLRVYSPSERVAILVHQLRNAKMPWG